MADDISRRIEAGRIEAGRIEAWLARCPDPESDPLPGMAEAGLLMPADSYMAIARTKAALVERTGVLGIGGIWGGRQMVGRYFIDGFATETQRAAWRGKAVSVAISEPGVGAHPKHLRTRAEPVAGGFRIDGEKAWVSNGPIADVIIVVAVTSEEAGTSEAAGRKRYGAFLVPRDTAGLSMKEMPGFHALRPSRHCHLVLDGCTVPADALLGELGTAYERMALPFRDQEDAVGTFGTLGGFRFLIARLERASEEAALSRGGLVALAAVFEAAATPVVAALDAGALRDGSATLVGLRVLAAEMLARAKAHAVTFGTAGGGNVSMILGDIEAMLNVARGPRAARQVRLGRGEASGLG
jgi:acyl-CoA dehydrogenase